MNQASRWILCSLLLASGSALAIGQDKPATPATATLPDWNQLTPTQRETLLTPLRERWDANPGDRAGMYEHARRWSAMTPAQRDDARRGVRHWEHMDPARRTEMRALFEKMKSMTPEQRKDLRDQWRAMSTEQRRAWVEANPPSKR